MNLYIQWVTAAIFLSLLLTLTVCQTSNEDVTTQLRALCPSTIITPVFQGGDLVELTIQNCKCGNMSIGMLSMPASLQALSIVNCKNTSFPYRSLHLQSPNSLANVAIRSNFQIAAEDYLHLLNQTTALSTLDLSKNTLSPAALAIILQKHKGLEELKLDDTGITHNEFRNILLSLKSLVSLSIINCKVALNTKYFPHDPDTFALQQLVLDVNTIPTLMDVLQVGYFVNLKYLSLWYVSWDINITGIELMAPNLAHIKFGGMAFQSVEPIRELKGLKKLQFIIMEMNGSQLSALIPATIEELFVYSCPHFTGDLVIRNVTDKLASVYIVESGLQSLSLIGPSGRIGWIKVVGCPHFRSLHLDIYHIWMVILPQSNLVTLHLNLSFLVDLLMNDCTLSTSMFNVTRPLFLNGLYFHNCSAKELPVFPKDFYILDRLVASDNKLETLDNAGTALSYTKSVCKTTI
jgi:hypothetical protein